MILVACLLLFYLQPIMRNLLTEYSPLHDSKHIKSPSKKRRTIGNIDDFHDHSWKYSSIHDSISSPNQRSYMTNPDYSKLVEENDKLRKEVQRLQNLVLYGQKGQKDFEKMTSSVWSKKGDKTPQDTGKMKKIIEKSYYSIKEMQKQISQLNQQISVTRKDCQKLTKKLQLTQIQRDELFHKLQNLQAIHKQEIWVCNERIRKLETHIDQLILISEHDQKQWRDHMNKLLQLKKFSFKRTSYK